MKKMIEKMRIKHKLWFLVGIAFLALLLLGGTVMLSLKKDIVDEKKTKTKHLVEAVYGILEYHERLAREGKVNEEEAKRRAKEIIRELRFDGKEYFWINDMKPVMIMHPYDPELNGKDVSNFQDKAGKKVFAAAVEIVKSQKAGFLAYLWPKPGVDVPVPKISYVKGFAPWGWVLGSGIYEEDVNALFREKGRNFALLLLLIAAALAGMAVLITRSITLPITFIQRKISRMAEGDMRVQEDELRWVEEGGGTNETARLLGACTTMGHNLSGLIGRVQHSGIQVTTSVTEIAASARQLESTVAEQAASIREVSAASKEISANSMAQVQAMDKVNEAASATAIMAETGRSNLTGMEGAMRQLMQATGSISSKLEVIHDKATKISRVVTTINKISDQTNLLSLNAAIEAEKAGEYGKGFSVVAREISRLADHTAVATQDIEYMVREMQSSVSSGVMEMDKFSEDVRRGVDQVVTIGAQLGQVIDQVRTLSPQFEQAKEGMNNQVEGAQQISEAMRQLSVAAETARESCSDFKRATEQLTAAVQVLQGEVLRFQVGA